MLRGQGFVKSKGLRGVGAQHISICTEGKLCESTQQVRVLGE